MADLVARFGDDAEQEAQRLLADACAADRSHDAQFWVSVIFRLARHPLGVTA